MDFGLVMFCVFIPVMILCALGEMGFLIALTLVALNIGACGNGLYDRINENGDCEKPYRNIEYLAIGHNLGCFLGEKNEHKRNS